VLSDRVRGALQNLVEDRFKMGFHQQTKELTFPALVARKGGWS
jgi:uncharacterized protein (TIGR03435 family)